MRKVAEIKICETCLTVADGDPAMGDAQTQADCAEAAKGLAENWPGLNVHGACGDNCHNGEFSWSECEGCGNPDGGHRHDAVVLGPDAHDVTGLVTEDPIEIDGVTYTARRNAEPEADGSWRWQVFADDDGVGAAGYLQSHRCPDGGAGDPIRLVPLGSNNLPVFAWVPGDRGDHRCVPTYTNALIWLHQNNKTTEG